MKGIRNMDKLDTLDFLDNKKRELAIISKLEINLIMKLIQKE